MHIRIVPAIQSQHVMSFRHCNAMGSFTLRLALYQGNHIFTSGAIGTNAAVIKGALRANAPDKLTVILPQSLKRQPADSQDLLSQVQH